MVGRVFIWNGLVSIFSQLNFPESTIIPPTEVAWPSIYLVVEWVTISAPNSNGLRRTGLGKVLSTISGILYLWQILAAFSISKTSTLGLDRLSAKNSLPPAFIASSKAFSSFRE